MHIENRQKKKLLYIGIGIVFLLFVLFLFFSYQKAKRNFYEPIKSLEKEQVVSASALRKINTAFYQQLSLLQIEEHKLLYLTGANQLTNSIYKGRLVDQDELLTYEFSISTLDDTVTIKEISKRQIDEEELQEYGG